MKQTDNNPLHNFLNATYDQLLYFDDVSITRERFDDVAFNMLRLAMDQNINSIEEFAGLFGHRILQLELQPDVVEREEAIILSVEKSNNDYIVAV